MIYIEKNDKPNIIEKILNLIKVQDSTIILPISKETTEKQIEKIAKKTVKIIGQSSYLGRSDSLRIFKLYLPIDLFNRIKLMSKFYGVSISKMMTQLL